MVMDSTRDKFMVSAKVRVDVAPRIVVTFICSLSVCLVYLFFNGNNFSYSIF